MSDELVCECAKDEDGQPIVLSGLECPIHHEEAAALHAEMQPDSDEVEKIRKWATGGNPDHGDNQADGGEVGRRGV